VIGIVGILEDVHQAVFPNFREPGLALVLLRASESGDLTDAESEFGSSEYAKEVLGAVWGFPPALELEREAALHQAVVEMIGAELVASAHDCAEGGIAVALAESSFPKGVGFTVTLASLGLPPEYILFGEDASRILISCDPGHLSRIKQLSVKHGLSSELIGETTSEQVEIKLDGRVVLSARVGDLRETYEGALEAVLRAEPVTAE
jgi:phosphoribosylformylglycinamidine synthase